MINAQLRSTPVSFKSNASRELNLENDILLNTIAVGKEQSFVANDIKEAVDTFVKASARKDNEEVIAASRMRDTIDVLGRIPSEVISDEKFQRTIDHARNTLTKYITGVIQSPDVIYPRLYGLMPEIKDIMNKNHHKVA